MYPIELQRSATYYCEQRLLFEASHDKLIRSSKVCLNDVQDGLCKNVNIIVL